MRWMGSFLSEGRVSLVVDCNQGESVEVETAVPQDSPVMPTLFAVYLSGIFREVEKKVEK